MNLEKYISCITVLSIYHDQCNKNCDNERENKNSRRQLNHHFPKWPPYNFFRRWVNGRREGPGRMVWTTGT